MDLRTVRTAYPGYRRSVLLPTFMLGLAMLACALMKPREDQHQMYQGPYQPAKLIPTPSVRSRQPAAGPLRPSTTHINPPASPTLEQQITLVPSAPAVPPAATNPATATETRAASAAATATPTFVSTAAPSATVTPTSTPTSTYPRQFPPIARNDSYLIGAYYYPWYGSNRRHWQGGYTGTPLLGEYDSASQEVINQHIDWASGHGIDFFALSWWGPDSPENAVIQNAFVKSDLIGDMRFAILYESIGRLNHIGRKIDLNDPTNRQILLDDLTFIQKTYWKHPQYLRINGKPVIFLYFTRGFTGDVAGALKAARDKLKEAGDDVYIIGDEVFWNTSYPMESAHWGGLDAVTTYLMYDFVPDSALNFTSRVHIEYRQWNKRARQMGVSFIPNILPGFNDNAAFPQGKRPPLDKTTDLFQLQVDMAFAQLDPGINMLMITSWNEWHEFTTIEPDQTFGFQFLDILKAALEIR